MLTDGASHAVDSSEMAFRIAAVQVGRNRNVHLRAATRAMYLSRLSPFSPACDWHAYWYAAVRPQPHHRTEAAHPPTGATLGQLRVGPVLSPHHTTCSSRVPRVLSVLTRRRAAKPTPPPCTCLFTIQILSFPSILISSFNFNYFPFPCHHAGVPAGLLRG